MTEALLLTMMDPPPDGDAEFNDWANTEHVPERKSIPGIRTPLRFRNKAPSPRYMTIYDLEDIAVLKGPAYMAIAGDNLSPWSRRILAGATARWRFEGSRIAAGAEPARTGGKGQFTELLLVLWRGVPARRDEDVVAALHEGIANAPGILQSRVFAGQRDGLTDYVGIVESAQPFDVGSADLARYSRAPHPSDFAHVFHPI